MWALFGLMRTVAGNLIPLATKACLSKIQTGAYEINKSVPFPPSYTCCPCIL